MEIIRSDAYSQYNQLFSDYLEIYGRVFHDYEARENTDLIPFNWTTDQSASYENFLQCLDAWEAAAETDPTINLVEEFNFTALDESGTKTDIIEFEEERKDLKLYALAEDSFDCSGMCMPSLFYFGRNISEDGYPKETCLHHIKNYIHENGEPYALSCSITAVLCFWMLLLHFGLYQCGPKQQQLDLDDLEFHTN